MNEIEAIVQLIMYLLAKGRILEATILIIMIYISLGVSLAIISIFLKLFLPEQKVPEKEVKERVKVVYIIQNSAGNEIRVEESDEDKLTGLNTEQEIIREEFSTITEAPPPHENNKPDTKNYKPYTEMSAIEWIGELIAYIIYMIVKIILMIIIIVMGSIVAGIAIKLLTEYIKNPQNF